jgi:aspartokinase/homoserine dehydrogenase 1
LLLLLGFPGTRVSDLASDEEVYQGKVTIKGFATIDQVTLISVEVRSGVPVLGGAQASGLGCG